MQKREIHTKDNFSEMFLVEKRHVKCHFLWLICLTLFFYYNYKNKSLLKIKM